MRHQPNKRPQRLCPSVFVSACLCVCQPCLLVGLFVCVYECVCASPCLRVYICLCPSAYESACLSVSIYMSESLRLPECVYLCVHVSVRLRVRLSVFSRTFIYIRVLLSLSLLALCPCPLRIALVWLPSSHCLMVWFHRRRALKTSTSKGLES